MTTIREILNTQPPEVWHASPEATVHEVVEIMETRNIGAVLVLECGKLVGIFSERDCARRLVLGDLSARATRVRELMSTPVLCTTPQQTIEECMTLMTEKHVRHLPVLEGDEVVGVVSMRAVVRHLISGRDHRIEQMQDYITGGG